MRATLLLLVAAAALAGCATPVQTAATDADLAPPEPYHAEGLVWLRSSTSESREALDLRYLVNGTGMLVRAELTFGEKYGVLEPPSTTDAQVELVAPDGAVLAEGARSPGGPAVITLEGVSAAAGGGEVRIRYYGGSDEGQSGGVGDYVRYVLDVTPAR